MAKYIVNSGGEEITLTDIDAKQLDVLSITKNQFHVLQHNKAYKVATLQTDFDAKTLTVEVNGNRYEVSISDEYDQMVKKMGLLVNTSKKENEIKAPMPGLIVDVMVKEGQEITEGMPLLVLSAMKMENIILAQADGTVKRVAIKKDDAVDKGQLIIEME